jgi:hypothetical protein
MSKDFFVLVTLALVVALLLPGRGEAHDLQGRVTLLPETVVVEAWFNDDTPAEGASVSVTTADGHVVWSGRTDEKGVCRLGKLTPGRYRAVIESVGHREEIEFPIESEGGLLEYHNWRMNKWLGVAIGVGGLLLLSSIFLLRRRGRPATRDHQA